MVETSDHSFDRNLTTFAATVRPSRYLENVACALTLGDPKRLARIEQSSIKFRAISHGELRRSSRLTRFIVFIRHLEAWSGRGGFEQRLRRNLVLASRTSEVFAPRDRKGRTARLVRHNSASG